MDTINITEEKRKLILERLIAADNTLCYIIENKKMVSEIIKQTCFQGELPK